MKRLIINCVNVFKVIDFYGLTGKYDSRGIYSPYFRYIYSKNYKKKEGVDYIEERIFTATIDGKKCSTYSNLAFSTIPELFI